MGDTIIRTATVVKNTGSHYLLSELPLWKPFSAVTRGRLRLKGSASTNPVAVGDCVEYSASADAGGGHGGDAVILSVLPRKNYIIRRSANLSRQCHVIAANIDTAYLIVTLDSPQTKWPFIDRFLVTCEAYKIPVTIILNKTDLYREDADLAALKGRFHEVYGSAGYAVMDVSVLTGEGVDGLREKCNRGGISMFSGISGVGKSSLIKAIDPALDPRTSEISDKYRQGRHTTTFYEIYPLCGGGFIIDTPGIRGFGLVDIDREEISTYFPEMLRVSDNCRYKPCTHTHEPGCAVLDAVGSGSISQERYMSYLGMLEDEGKYR
ncbi:MAG TPA: ribosome small subunit-dependent GTPase A [Candidatus Coprenecus stercoripullorum]|nr:ribosome small subunit-dependent GTPase A [Candidatus Coprenecus stercoripullorum]